MRDGKLVPADFNRAENFFRIASAVVRRSMQDRVRDEKPAVYGMAKESVRINRITEALDLVRSLRERAVREPDLLQYMDFDYVEGERIVEEYQIQLQTKTLPEINNVKLEDFYFTDQVFLKFFLMLCKEDIVKRLAILGNLGTGFSPLVGVNGILALMRQLVVAMELVRELAECCYRDLQYLDIIQEIGQENYPDLLDAFHSQIKNNEQDIDSE